VGETGSKPLAGKRVMVTRAAEQSQTLVNALLEAGAEAVMVPLVAFAAPDDTAELDRCLRDGARFDWVFFTSQNAVRAVQERCTALGCSLKQSFSTAKIAAVAPTTAEAARGAGLHVDYVSRVHNGVALAGELSGEVRGKRVLLPRSDRANPDLIEELERFGAQATPVVAYKTVGAEFDAQRLQEVMANRPVDAVLFFSPSAVHHLRELAGVEKFRNFGRQAAFVAIGPVSERALKEEGVERILTAADTTVAASIAALREFFSKAGQAQPAGAKPR
jgi:uroporphyrinogen-III synthase